jgi:hypothetical protein
MKKIYQGSDYITKVEIDFEKSIIIVELSNKKRYFKEFENIDFENLQEQIKRTAEVGEKC